MKVAAIIIIVIFSAVILFCAAAFVVNCAKVWNVPESARTMSQYFSLAWPLIVGAMAGLFMWIGIQLYREHQ